VSKRPFLDDALNGCSNDGVLALQRIDFGGREVLIGAAHLHWPWPSPQAQQITQMRDRLRKAGDASGGLVFAGDLNAAPWSHSAERIANFLNAQPVTLPWGSWVYHTLPADYAWLGLPLDNVFARGVTVTSAKRGVPFGSDHLPALVEFEITETPEQGTKTVLAN
jgi:endonuclease/exonuclease/phosphatase (EEP) superfamily protein YafD